MSKDSSKQEEPAFIPPVSAFCGPIAELVGHRLLSPPTRPGLLASLGRYEVVRVLGGGGMGVVVLARDPEKGKDVAIKLIKPELVSDQRIVHRFVKEAGHLQKLKHPNVVPVVEISERAEGPYFVMPYFERGSLAQRIKPGQPMESEVILDISLQVAEGLVFAHRRGIIHRDLKPANILLGNDGKTCLADFGLARTMFNDSIIDVEREQLEGTAPYMSPGVAAGNAEDTRCDIYAFGALLYEMLTGEPPYAGRNTSDIRRQILAGPPKPIRARNPAADSGLVTVAEGAMARELRDRYADMADVLADLERVKSGKPATGPHGLSRRVKDLPFSPWVPGGILLIAVGLWLMWPPTPAQAPVSAPVVKPTNSLIVTPPGPSPGPGLAPKPPIPTVTTQTNWHVSMIAGQPGTGGSADGVGGSARFNSPGGIAVDLTQNIYIADTGNNTIRRMTRDGAVSTLAGAAGQPGRSDGPGSEARFLAPMGIAVDSFGNIYVAEFANDTIRKITPKGEVTTVAGLAGIPGSQDGVGNNAHFRNPWSVAAGMGNLYVADKSNFTIRQINQNDQITTLAGTVGKPGYADGPAARAKFGEVQGIAIDPIGSIYVADAGNNVIRKIGLPGVVSTWAGAAGSPGSVDGTGSNARFSNIEAVAMGELGDLYVLDGGAIRRINFAGKVETLPKASLLGEQGQRIHPTSMTVDYAGNLYLVEVLNNVIWKIVPPAKTRLTERAPRT